MQAIIVANVSSETKAVEPQSIGTQPWRATLVPTTPMTPANRLASLPHRGVMDGLIRQTYRHGLCPHPLAVLSCKSAFDSGFPSHVVGDLFEDGERRSFSVTASNESSVRDPKRRSSTRRIRRRTHTRSRIPRQSRSGLPSMRRSEGRGWGSRCRSRPDRRNDRTPDRLRARTRR